MSKKGWSGIVKIRRWSPIRAGSEDTVQINNEDYEINYHCSVDKLFIRLLGKKTKVFYYAEFISKTLRIGERAPEQVW
jgi:hypothetical protein